MRHMKISFLKVHRDLLPFRFITFPKNFVAVNCAVLFSKKAQWKRYDLNHQEVYCMKIKLKNDTAVFLLKVALFSLNSSQAKSLWGQQWREALSKISFCKKKWLLSRAE